MPSWKIFSGEIIGRGHGNALCQDKTLVLTSGEDFFLGLADGAGSAQFSDIGAECSLHAIRNFLLENFDDVFSSKDLELVKRVLIKEILSSLKKESDSKGSKIEEFASTLLFAVSKNKKLIIGHIGDGAILIKKSNETKVLSQGQKGEFANATYFTTSKQILSCMFLAKGDINSLNGIILMSDGSQSGLISKSNQKISPLIEKIFFWTSFLNPTATRAKVKDVLKLLRLRTMDDCSIAGIVRIPTIDSLPEEDQFALFRIFSPNRARKRLKILKTLLKILDTERNLSKISREMRLKEKHLKKRITYLKNIGLYPDTTIQTF